MNRYIDGPGENKRIKVSIIGSTGQLGNELVKTFKHNGHEVVPLTHHQVEVKEFPSVESALQAARPDAVINCASFLRVDDAEESAEEAFRVNAIGALYVARACASLGAAYVYISTDYVFDGHRSHPYTEEDTTHPLNVYGVSKLAGEYLVRYICPKHYVVRSSGLYGVRGSQSKGGNFVETMLRLGKEKGKVRVVADQVLTPTYTADLASKVYEVIQKGAYGLYHITNSGSCSWHHFAQEIFELARLTVEVEPITSQDFGAKATRPAYSVLANTALQRQGIEQLRPWQQALAAYISQRGGN